ncbi:hypothetical protein UA45_19575 [Morganella morganii]|uniref:Uncharacterized protein n=1 Tax=Morganella morganii TaxID=582 RepID=A0A0D8L2X4_MORMO|nr:hypothetical protein UA45_19575 [Morganella morganii]
MVVQMFCNNVIFTCFLFKQIYLFRCELVYILHNTTLLQNRDKPGYHRKKPFKKCGFPHYLLFFKIKLFFVECSVIEGYAENPAA